MGWQILIFGILPLEIKTSNDGMIEDHPRAYFKIYCTYSTHGDVEISLDVYQPISCTCKYYFGLCKWEANKKGKDLAFGLERVPN